jgi:hypothetical protein
MLASVRETLLPPGRTPKILVTPRETHTEHARRLFEKGYAFIGYSEFEEGFPTQAHLFQQATNVGADYVLYSSYLSHTEAGVRAKRTYEPGQTYTSQHSGYASASAESGDRRARGSGHYSGTTSTTSSGSYRTDYVPYEHRVQGHEATFWRRTKPNSLGVLTVPISESLRLQLQRNVGAVVEAVIDGGAAFTANVLRGDVIIQLAEHKVLSPDDLFYALPRYQGLKVPVKVIRGDRTMSIEVDLKSRN